MTGPARRVAQAIALPLALFLALLLWANANHNLYVSTPQQILQETGQWGTSGVWHDLLPSLESILVGFALSVVVGIALGVLIGSSQTVQAIANPIVDFVRAIPMAALVPVLLLIIGFSVQSRVVIVFLGAVWPILLGAMDGVLGIDPRLHDVARTYRVGRVSKFFRLTLRAASPQILAGVRTALSVAIVVVVVVAEMFGSTNGVGHFIIQSQQTFNIAGVWMGTIIFGLLGYVLNAIFHRVQRRLLRWQPSPDDLR